MFSSIVLKGIRFTMKLSLRNLLLSPGHMFPVDAEKMSEIGSVGKKLWPKNRAKMRLRFFFFFSSFFSSQFYVGSGAEPYAPGLKISTETVENIHVSGFKFFDWMSLKGSYPQYRHRNEKKTTEYRVTSPPSPPLCRERERARCKEWRRPLLVCTVGHEKSIFLRSIKRGVAYFTRVAVACARAGEAVCGRPLLGNTV